MSAPESPAPTPVQSEPTGVVSSGWLGANSAVDRREPRRILNGLGLSLALHGAVVGIILAILASHPDTVYDLQQQVIRMVYLEAPGPGGGGGGSPAPAPKRELQVPEQKASPTPPVIPPPVPPPLEPPPVLNAPIMTTSANLVQAAGVNSVSLANYAGGGRGGGLGQGQGSGVGEGSGGGTGGGVYEMGSGIRNPTVLRQVKPEYSAEAMRASVRGMAVVEAIVLEDGTVGEVKITKSLDRVYGLDEKALVAAKQWLFTPGVDRDGRRVKVRVRIELVFALH